MTEELVVLSEKETEKERKHHLFSNWPNIDVNLRVYMHACACVYVCDIKVKLGLQEGKKRCGEKEKCGEKGNKGK